MGSTLSTAKIQKPPISSVCYLVDTNNVHNHFSRYPAAINVANDLVESTLRSLGEKATEPNTRVRRRVQIRHECPFGDPFAICHSSAFPERLLILGSIIEVMWIHDDVTEELSFNAAMNEHEILAEVIRIDIDPTTLKPKNIRQKLLAEVVREAIDMDPNAAPAMIKILINYIMTFDNCDDEPDDISKYMPFRIANSGYWMSSYFILWGMATVLTGEEYESIREYDKTMGIILGLTNDYFSWDVEKDQPADRVHNGVRVLMKQHGVPANVAKSLLLGIIVEKESKAAKLREERLKKPASEGVLRYIEAIELYVGGSCYWHATAPRYQRFE